MLVTGMLLLAVGTRASQRTLHLRPQPDSALQSPQAPMHGREEVRLIVVLGVAHTSAHASAGASGSARKGRA